MYFRKKALLQKNEGHKKSSTKENILMRRALMGFRFMMVLGFALCLVEARAEEEPGENENGYIISFKAEDGPSEKIWFNYKVIEPFDKELPESKWKGEVSLFGLKEGESVSSVNGVVGIQVRMYYNPIPGGSWKNERHYYVVSIEANAFKNRTDIKKVTFPAWEYELSDYYKYSSGMTSIGDNAFLGCSALEKISWYLDKNISKNQQGDGYQTFVAPYTDPEYQDAFPPSLKQIGKHAFKDTPLTGKITIGDSIKTIDAGAFENTRITELTITWEDSETMEIAAEAFAGCTMLEKLTIKSSEEGAGTVHLASGAFAGCTALKAIIFDAAVTVESGVFPNSTSLQQVEVTAGGVSFDAGAFGGCSSLEEIKYEGDDEGKPILKGSLSDVFGGIPDECTVNGTWVPAPTLTIQGEELSFVNVNESIKLRAIYTANGQAQLVSGTGVTWTEQKPQGHNALVLKPFQTEEGGVITDGGIIVYPLYNETIQSTDIKSTYDLNPDALFDIVTITFPTVTVEPETPATALHSFVNQPIELKAIAKQAGTPFDPDEWKWELTGKVSFVGQAANTANVTFTGSGEATITATALRKIDGEPFPGPSHTWSFTVPAPDTIVTTLTATVNGEPVSAASIKTKETITLTAAVTVDGVSVTDLDEGTLTWTVNETYFDWNYVGGKGNVITLTPKQYVTATPNFTIQVRHKNDTPETFTLTLLKPEIEVTTSVQQGSALSPHVGETATIEAVVRFDGEAVAEEVATLEWHASSETIFAFETKGARSAVIKGLAVGTANVWATLPNWDNMKSNEQAVTVSIPDTTVTGITATVNGQPASTASIKRKESITLTAAVTVDGVSVPSLDEGTLTWTINEGYFECVHVSGNVITLTPKQYVMEDQLFSIQAKHKSDDTPETFSLTLLKPDIKVTASVQQGSTLSLHTGETSTIEAVVHFDGEVVAEEVTTLEWHSSNTATLSLETKSSRSIEVKALTTGTATVWASLPAWNNTTSTILSVAVDVPPLQSLDTTVISVTAEVDAIKTKETITVTANVTVEEVLASSLDEGTLIWTVPEIFEWSYVNNKGNVITITPKQYLSADQTFTLQAKHTSDDTPATFSLTLLKPEIEVATSVQQGSTLSLYIGDTRDLNAVVSFDGDAVSDEVATLAWHSSDEAIVLFETESSRSAVITGLSTGEATVYATLPTWDNKKSNVLAVTVSPAPAYSIDEIGDATLFLNRTQTLEVSVRVDGSPLEEANYPALYWSAKDDKVSILPLTEGSVSVTAKQVGETELYVGLEEGGKLQTVKISVPAPSVQLTVDYKYGNVALPHDTVIHQDKYLELTATVTVDGEKTDTAQVVWDAGSLERRDNPLEKQSAKFRATQEEPEGIIVSANTRIEGRTEVIASTNTILVKVIPAYSGGDFTVPDDAQLVILAPTDIVRSNEPLQLSVAFLLNGITLNVTPEELDAAGVTVEWESLDFEYSTDDFIEVDDNGLVLVAKGRQAGDSAQIVARIEAMGRVLADTFTVYVEKYPPTGIEAIIPEVTFRTVMLRTDGLYLTGFAPADRVTVYTIDGRILLHLPASTDFAPHPFRPHTLYIIHTPEAVFKRTPQP
jgi:hypothetical protein